jgi:hypothetical protein
VWKMRMGFDLTLAGAGQVALGNVSLRRGG